MTLEIPPKKDPKVLEAELEKIEAQKKTLEAKKNALKNNNRKPAGTPPKKETFTQALNRQIAEKNKNLQKQKAAGTPPPQTPNSFTVAGLGNNEENNDESFSEMFNRKLAEKNGESQGVQATGNPAPEALNGEAKEGKFAGLKRRMIEGGKGLAEKMVDSLREDEDSDVLSPVEKKWKKGREIVARNKKREARIGATVEATREAFQKGSEVVNKLKESGKKGLDLAGSAIANREGFGMEMTGVADETKEPTVEKEPSPFTHLFGNLGEKLTETVPGFEKLSSGQQLLVMQGIQERIYATVKSEAKELHAESVKKSGFWEKIGRNITKNFQVANNETATLKNFKNDTDGKLTALLQAEGKSVAERIAKSGLEGYLAEDNKTIVTDYVGVEKSFEANSTRTKMMGREFNQAASEMARIPKKWSYPEASRAQKEAYKQAENALMIARDRFLPMLAADNANQKVPNAKLEAATLVRNSETMMETMRFLSADPNTMKRLESIGTTSTILRGLNNTITEKGAYMAGGYLGRTALAGTLGAVAGPAIAFITGGIRGYNKAKSTIREQAELASSGITQKRDSKEAKKLTAKYAPLIEEARSAMAQASTEDEKQEILAQIQKYSQLMNAGGTTIGAGSSERHMKRLADTLAAIEVTNIEPERQQLLSKLKTYTDFIETKIELGQVNFGPEKEVFARQYDLMEKLHTAKATIGVHLQHDIYAQAAEESMHSVKNKNGEEYSVTLSHDMRGLINRMGGANQANVEKARKMMITKEVLKGATLGATFATLGVLARNFAEAHGWIDAKTSGVTSASAEGKTPTTTSEVLDSKIQAIKDSAVVNPKTPEVETPELENSSLSEEAIPENTPQLEEEKSVASIENGGTPSTEIAPTPTTATESIPTITSTEVKAGEGAADALLRLKNNPNLTEGQKEFFNRNLWAVAKDLRMVDPRTGGGIEVPAGATLSIEEDGSIVLADPNNSGARTLLGTVKGDGEFIKNTSDEIRYRLPRVKSIENLRTEGARMLSTENGETPFSPTEREIPIMTEGGEAGDGVERLDATNYKFSDKTLNQITRAEHRDIDRELTKFFGTDYEQSRTWKAVSKMDAQEFLERSREDFSSEYVGFYDDVTELANKLPLDPTGKNLEQYVNGLYEFNERDLAFKKEIAELTREQIVKNLNSIFGDKPLNNPEWKQVGEMNAFEFFSRDRATYPEKTKLLYDNLSKLIVRVGKGPEVLPVGQRSIKNYLEYLYEMDTRKTLNAEIYN